MKEFEEISGRIALEKLLFKEKFSCLCLKIAFLEEKSRAAVTLPG